MTAATITPSAPIRRISPARMAISDARTMTWRNLRAMTRVPEVIVFSTIQPIIFVLTFRYVFGGAVRTPEGIEYVDFNGYVMTSDLERIEWIATTSGNGSKPSWLITVSEQTLDETL